MAKKFPNLEKEADLQLQEVQKVPNTLNSEKHTKTRYN